MKTAVVHISGFGDRDPRCGTARLRRACATAFSGRAEVMPLNYWDEDMRWLAGMLHDRGFGQVLVAAHSWGAGFAAPNLCRNLARLRIGVPVLALCDPVYRPRWLPRFFGANPLCIRAVIPDSAHIRIPSNVGRIVGFRQVRSVPAGHPLKPDSPQTKVRCNGDGRLPVLNYRHTEIDDAPEWHGLVLDAFGSFINQCDS